MNTSTPDQPGSRRPQDQQGTVRTASSATELGVADYRALTPAEQMTYPWCCVGRLEAKPPGGTFQHAGTATLVGPKMILTASHCFRGRLFNEGWKFRFTPAYAGGRQAHDPTGGNHVRTGLTPNMVLGRPDHRGGSGLYDRVAGWDFAICELEVALGDYWGHVGVYAAAKHTYDDVRWTSIGYPVGLLDGEQPILFPGIDVHDVDEDRNDSREIETDDYVLRAWDGDFADGWSGGPLLAVRHGSWVVAGVLSGTEGDGPDIDGTNVFAGGPRLLAAHREAHARWSRFDWSGWFPVGGAFPAGCSTAVVARRPDTFELFGRGNDGRIWQNDYPTTTPNGWTGWNASAPGASTSGSPTAASWSPDHVTVFFIGTDGQAWTSNWYDDSGWAGPFPLGGSFQPGDGIAVVARRTGCFELFGRGADGRLWQNDYRTSDAKGWTGWNPTAPGAVAAGAPTALSWSPDHVSVFFVGTDGQAWTINWYDDSGWSPLFPLGGAFHSGDSIAVVARRPRTFELFGRGSDNRIWQNDYDSADPAGWSGWIPTAPGIVANGSPTALSPHPDTVQLFVTSDDGQVHTTFWGNLDA